MLIRWRLENVYTLNPLSRKITRLADPPLESPPGSSIPIPDSIQDACIELRQFPISRTEPGRETRKCWENGLPTNQAGGLSEVGLVRWVGSRPPSELHCIAPPGTGQFKLTGSVCLLRGSAEQTPPRVCRLNQCQARLSGWLSYQTRITFLAQFPSTIRAV